jgi:hypothetical protein
MTPSFMNALGANPRFQQVEGAPTSRSNLRAYFSSANPVLELTREVLEAVQCASLDLPSASNMLRICRCLARGRHQPRTLGVCGAADCRCSNTIPDRRNYSTANSTACQQRVQKNDEIVDSGATHDMSPMRGALTNIRKSAQLLTLST